VICPRPPVHQQQRVAAADDVDEERHISNRDRCS